jgi:hypothetical protein
MGSGRAPRRAYAHLSIAVGDYIAFLVDKNFNERQAGTGQWPRALLLLASVAAVPQPVRSVLAYAGKVRAGSVSRASVKVNAVVAPPTTSRSPASTGSVSSSSCCCPGAPGGGVRGCRFQQFIQQFIQDGELRARFVQHVCWFASGSRWSCSWDQVHQQMLKKLQRQLHASPAGSIPSQHSPARVPVETRTVVESTSGLSSSDVWRQARICSSSLAAGVVLQLPQAIPNKAAAQWNAG